MLSTISPISQAETLPVCNGGVGYENVFLSFKGGFTPWENFESFFVSLDYKSDSKPNRRLHHVGLESNLNDPNQKSLDFNEISDNNHESPNQTSTITCSGSDDLNQNSGDMNFGSSHYNQPNQITTLTDERKRKRKISNRESAKRSRMRKQTHVDNLRNEANRLKIENEEGTNRLGVITHNIHLIRSDNDRLMLESVILQRRLMELSQIWQLQQLLHRNNNHDTSPCNPMQMIRR